MDNPFKTEIPIFNHQFKLVTIDNEFGMSQWVKGFGVLNDKGETVLAFTDSFNLDHYEIIEDLLRVSFQIYPHGSKTYVAEINLFNRIFVYNGDVIALEQFKSTFYNLV